MKMFCGEYHNPSEACNTCDFDKSGASEVYELQYRYWALSTHRDPHGDEDLRRFSQLIRYQVMYGLSRTLEDQLVAELWFTRGKITI